MTPKSEWKPVGRWDNQPDSSKRNSSAQLYPKSYSSGRKQKCSFSDAVVISFNYMRILPQVTLLLGFAEVSLCSNRKIPYIIFVPLVSPLCSWCSSWWTKWKNKNMTTPHPQAVKLEHKPQHMILPGAILFPLRLKTEQVHFCCTLTTSRSHPHHSKIQNRELERERNPATRSCSW